MEDRILALYACGMSQRDIAEQIKSLYDVEISPEPVSKIIKKLIPEVTAWQNRPLEPVYSFVFMDAIRAVYPKSRLQRCITRYVSYKGLKASQRIVKHWHARCQDLDLVLSQLQILLADRGVGGSSSLRIPGREGNNPLSCTLQMRYS